MSEQRTIIKGLGFCGNEPLAGSNAAAVDVKDGKIVRIRPLHFDWKYRPEDRLDTYRTYLTLKQRAQFL